MRAMPMLEPGTTIRDTYEVERLLGEGGFAVVYRVHHRFLGRQAMKVFKQTGMEVGEVEALLDEAILLSRLGHPNIVRVFDANVFEWSGATCGYFTMEYVPGGSLDRYWRSYREKFMPVEETVEILRQACAGIAVGHAESTPIIHRDIKPQNILVGYDGSGMRVRVSDFGLARRVNPLTLVASAKGTLGFKPPEAFEDMDSRAADVWGLGTVLYLLLTDTLPYPALQERALAEVKNPLPPLRPASFYNIRVDPELDAIAARCLAIEPKDRYPDAMALLADLRRWTPGSDDRTQAGRSWSKTGKVALGVHRSTSKKDAEKMVREALRLASSPGRLTAAADLLEEALNRDASLRERYESQLLLWRRGICM